MIPNSANIKLLQKQYWKQRLRPYYWRSEALSLFLSINLVAKHRRKVTLQFTVLKSLFTSFSVDGLFFLVMKAPCGSLFSQMCDLLHLSSGSRCWFIHDLHAALHYWKSLLQALVKQRSLERRLICWHHSKSCCFGNSIALFRSARKQQFHWE